MATPSTPFRWTDALNGREWATVVWFALILAVAMSQRNLRASALGILGNALSKVVLVPLLLMFAYIAAVVFVGSSIDLWSFRLLGATLAWLVASALLGFFRVTEIPDDPHYFRTALAKAAKITVLIEAYVNLFVLPFWAEMLLLPVAASVAALLAYVETTGEAANIRGCLNTVAVLLGFGLIIYATIHFVSELSNLGNLGKSLILPLWLNLALIPFTYLLAVRVVYETAFMRLGFAGNATRASLRRAKLALLLDVGPRPYALGDFGPPWPYRLNAASTLADARQVAGELRAERNASADS